MIIYNVTVSIDKEVSDEWVAWMREVHIPDVMATGLFLEHRFAKVLLVDDEGGLTYTTQYVCNSMSELQRYHGSHAPRLQADVKEKFDGKYVAFRTVLETIETP
jgi:predicted transport protein